MVKHPPTTMVRVVIAFALTAVFALAPMALLLVLQHGMPSGDAVAATSDDGVAIVLALVAVVAVAATAVATVTLGAQRRLRPARG